MYVYTPIVQTGTLPIRMLYVHSYIIGTGTVVPISFGLVVDRDHEGSSSSREGPTLYTDSCRRSPESIHSESCVSPVRCCWGLWCRNGRSNEGSNSGGGELSDRQKEVGQMESQWVGQDHQVCDTSTTFQHHRGRGRGETQEDQYNYISILSFCKGE